MRKKKFAIEIPSFGDNIFFTSSGEDMVEPGRELFVALLATAAMMMTYAERAGAAVEVEVATEPRLP